MCILENPLRVAKGITTNRRHVEEHPTIRTPTTVHRQSQRTQCKRQVSYRDPRRAETSARASATTQHTNIEYVTAGTRCTGIGITTTKTALSTSAQPTYFSPLATTDNARLASQTSTSSPRNSPKISRTRSVHSTTYSKQLQKKRKMYTSGKSTTRSAATRPLSSPPTPSLSRTRAGYWRSRGARPITLTC